MKHSRLYHVGANLGLGSPNIYIPRMDLLVFTNTSCTMIMTIRQLKH